MNAQHSNDLYRSAMTNRPAIETGFLFSHLSEEVPMSKGQ